jgi:iron only hydrogenase large subunit-like protein
MRELEEGIKKELVGVNEDLEVMKELRDKFSKEKLGGVFWRLLDLEENRSVVVKGGFSVRIKVGEEYGCSYGSVVSGIRNDVEKELILEGLKGEFDLNEMMKRMIEKFS